MHIISLLNAERLDTRDAVPVDIRSSQLEKLLRLEVVSQARDNPAAESKLRGRAPLNFAYGQSGGAGNRHPSQCPLVPLAADYLAYTSRYDVARHTSPA